MAIQYPVDVENTLWSVYQVSQSKIVAENRRWPRANGEAIPELDPDYVMLLQNETTPPEYDPRLYKLERSNGVIDITANTISWTWQVLPQDPVNIKAEIINEESIRFGRIAKIEQALTDVYLLAVATAAVVKDSETMTPAAIRLYNSMRPLAVKLYKNRARREALETVASAGQIPTNIDAGWEDA